MDDNPYRSPQVEPPTEPRVRLRWWEAILVVFIITALMALLWPAISAGRYQPRQTPRTITP